MGLFDDVSDAVDDAVDTAEDVASDVEETVSGGGSSSGGSGGASSGGGSGGSVSRTVEAEMPDDPAPSAALGDPENARDQVSDEAQDFAAFMEEAGFETGLVKGRENREEEILDLIDQRIQELEEKNTLGARLAGTFEEAGAIKELQVLKESIKQKTTEEGGME